MDENMNPTGAGAASADMGDEGGGQDRGGRFGKAREAMGEKFSSARESVRDGYNTMRERVDDVDVGALSDQVRTYVRSNPGKALLISLGVGFLVGLLLRRDDED